MDNLVGPIAFAVLGWWIGTGAILWLARRPLAWRGRVLALGTVALVLALAGLQRLSSKGAEAAPVDVYLAFVAALVVWGWQELAFLLGIVTGPRRSPCPEPASGWRRTRFATEAVLHHEIALVVLGALLFATAPDDGPAVAWWTFVALWLMRLSAKLNLFLGVPNLNAHLLPVHLRYLASYFRQRPMNRLLPVVLLAACAAAGWLWHAALAGAPAPADRTALLLVATLLTLGIVEHLLMVLPLPQDALWQWAMSPPPPGPGDRDAR